MESVFRIPKRHNDVCVDRSRHSSSYPRSSRIHFCTAFLPFPIPGLPIPMYFAKGLSFRTAVTRIPFPSSSNCNRSPARTPSRRLTSRGMVICPLFVTFACFFIATFSSPISSFCLLVSSFPSPISLLYHTFLTSELAVTKRCGSCLSPPFHRGLTRETGGNRGPDGKFSCNAGLPFPVNSTPLFSCLYKIIRKPPQTVLSKYFICYFTKHIFNGSMGRDLQLRSTPSHTVPSRDENPVTATPFIPHTYKP